MEKAFNDIEKGINLLNASLKKIRKTYPRSCWFLGNGVLYLMRDTIDDNIGSNRREEDILYSKILRHSDGGDW